MVKEKKCLILMSIFIILLCFSFNVCESVDNDLLWHFKLGEHILHNGISTKDMFSWQQGLNWISQEWLFDVYIYIIIKYTGMLGFTISMALTFFAVAYISFKENNKYIKCVPLFIAFQLFRFLFTQNYFNRPSLYSIIVIMLLINVLIKNEKKYKHYLYIFLLGVLIANIHGGAIITCAGIIAIFFVLDFILFLLKGNMKQCKNVFSDMISLPVFLIGTLINPYFHKIFEVGLKGPFLESTSYISEWRNWNISSYTDILAIIISLLMIIAIVYSNGFRKLKRKPFIILAFTCGFLILGLMSIRGLQIFSCFIVIYGYRYLQDFILFMLKKANLSSVIDVKCFKKKGVIYVAYFLCFLFVAFLFPQNETIYSYKYESFEKIVESHSRISYKILDYMNKNFDDNTRIFNFYNDGNYMIFKDIKVFIDSRQHPYTEEFSNNDSVIDVFSILYSKDYYNDFKKIFDKYEIEYVFWSSAYNINKDVIEDFENDWDVIVCDKPDGCEYNQYLFKRK